MSETVSLQFQGRTLSIETGRMAKQADGSAVVRYGETMVLVTAVSPVKPPEGKDFFPLSVDYREKSSAAGRFPGGYIKRDSRPSEKEILTARLTDRPLRPLFPDGYMNEVQIMASVLSADDLNDPDVLATIGASAALSVSDIPFLGPAASVRVGLIDDQIVINPTHEQAKRSTLDLMVAGTRKAVTMIEGFCQELSEETMLEAVYKGHEAIVELVALQEELAKKVGKAKREPVLRKVDEAIFKKVDAACRSGFEKAVVVKEKLSRQELMAAVRQETLDALKAEDAGIDEKALKQAISKVEKDVSRKIILEKRVRSDGRGPKDIRPISSEVGVLPRVHGSALFTRGETQALASVTLGSAGDAQRMDGLMGEISKSFMLHYNFPPYSVGEAGPIRGPGRREIGHGNLAERALAGAMPDKESFPYTVRITSDILESNGSSSMASVCGGTLALMDAGVPIKAPVAGIAMGLVSEGDNVVVLSDILGSEDATGEMDFKVAGTAAGITAFQLDIKTEGITRPIMQQALAQALEGRLHILGKMNETMSKSREGVSQYAPRIISLKIPQDKIGTVIGPGGKMIKKIVEETGVQINIDNDGTVNLSCPSSGNADKAVEMIESLTADVIVGKIYKGTVKNCLDFGCFVEVLPGKEGLVHVSKLAAYRVSRVEDVAKNGDEMYVKVTEIDDRGRINLSRRAALEEMGQEDPTRPPGAEDRPDVPEERASRGGRPDRGDRGGRGGRGGRRDFRGDRKTQVH